MTGVLSGLRVLDLSWGVAGPIATMLLADNGADVVKIEPEGGDPFRTQSGYRVWNRGKRSAVIDLRAPGGAEALARLAERADVLVESFSPGTMARLGLDWETLAPRCPRLVYCSITGYGQHGKHADRPAYDALVAARTGQQWESRGVVGGTIARLGGTEGMLPGIEAPAGCWTGAPRQGPLFSGIPWASHAAALLAAIAISAGLRVREVTGRGQWVQTSLFQGMLITTSPAWQRVERPDSPNYQSWVNDPRAPHGFFKCADDRWIQQWMSLPSFLIGAAAGQEMAPPETLTGTRGATDRIGPQASEMIVLHYYNEIMAEAVAKFPSDQWVRLAADVGVPLQLIRSPEESLQDPLLRADGCVTAVPDPEIGPVLQVGRAYELERCPIEINRPGPQIGTHTSEVLAESGSKTPPSITAQQTSTTLRHPLEGITVLDFGLAVAGPYGAQILSDLGAEVIKINRFNEEFWMSVTWAQTAHRGKRSIGLDLKNPDAREVIEKLVRRADVVMHNMRLDAAARIGIDEATLRAIRPDLIYCHTRGHDRSHRETLPGNDQTGGALAGMQWLEGGLDDGGEPIWPCISLGDPGNGLLAALAVVQAIYHRERTGEGQSVNTAIVNSHLLNCSSAWVTEDGQDRADRPSLDRMQLGWNALYRLYETESGWLCLAVRTDAEWRALCTALGSGLETDPRFVDAQVRRFNDSALAKVLTETFAEQPAPQWFSRLDAGGVPCEISDPDFVLGLFDDDEFKQRNWVTSYQHPVLGKMDMAGLLFDFSDTPGRIAGPPFVPGQHTEELLRSLGYSESQISQLIASGAAFIAKETARADGR